MSDLTKKKCIPCEGGVIPFDISEIHKYQKKVDGWDIIKNEKNVFLLEKKFTFKNFLESQNFVNEVGKLSEEEGHHPDILFGWGYAKNIDDLSYKKLNIGFLNSKFIDEKMINQIEFRKKQFVK